MRWLLAPAIASKPHGPRDFDSLVIVTVTISFNINFKVIIAIAKVRIHEYGQACEAA